MNMPPGAIYTAAQVRELDRRAIEVCGIPGYELMTRAGHALADAVRELWPAARSITVLAGPGKNAGDGYICARVARARGVAARVLTLASPDGLTGDARRACEEFHAAGGRSGAFDADAIDGDVIVDAIFGIGIARPVADPHAAAIEAANASGRPLLAVDLPSGLDADTGHPHGIAIRADATLSFIGRKLGCYVGAGPDQRAATLRRSRCPGAGLFGRARRGEPHRSAERSRRTAAARAVRAQGTVRPRAGDRGRAWDGRCGASRR